MTTLIGEYPQWENLIRMKIGDSVKFKDTTFTRLKNFKVLIEYDKPSIKKISVICFSEEQLQDEYKIISGKSYKNLKKYLKNCPKSFDN